MHVSVANSLLVFIYQEGPLQMMAATQPKNLMTRDVWLV